MFSPDEIKDMDARDRVEELFAIDLRSKGHVCVLELESCPRQIRWCRQQDKCKYKDISEMFAEEDRMAKERMDSSKPVVKMNLSGKFE